jgi:hypothetical protein
MSFTIEKNVPIPPKANRGRFTQGSVTWPFDKMEKDDSFAFPVGNLNKVRCSAGCHNVKGQKYFTVRLTEDGARCWRVR